MSTMQDRDSGVPVEHLTSADSAVLFEDASMRLMGMPGAEFLSCYQAGGFEGRHEPAFSELEMLIPFAQ